MTRVVVLPSDESACGWYRMRLPAGAVRKARPEWEIEVYRPRDVQLGVGAAGELWGIKGLDLRDADLLIMQRVATRAQAEFLGFAQSKGIATIVDSDDAMWCIDRENVAWSSWNEGLHHWRWIDTAATSVDLTTVTTRALQQRYGKHGRSEVLPNCVPEEVDTIIESARGGLDPRPTLGWAGFTSTHPQDLTVVGSAVRDVQRDTDCLIRVIGDAEGAARDWQVDEVDHVQPTAIGVPYYTALTSLDIGLVPLRDTTFNRAKSYLKALEFAASGVVVVASPTPANYELAKTVPIELVSTPEEWYAALHKAITNEDWRVDRAYYAKEAALKHHTYEANAEKWAQVWERAMVRRSRMMV